MPKKPVLNLRVVRERITNAQHLCGIYGVEKIDIKLPSPYADVTVHWDGTVIVTETGMRVYSLEEDA